MRKLFLTLPIAGLICMASCSNPTAPQPVSVQNTPAATPVIVQSTPAASVNDDVPRISLADAKKDFDAGTAVFIDTHVKEQFELQHIQGAINVPFGELETKLNKIPKGKKIIAYCS